MFLKRVLTAIAFVATLATAQHAFAGASARLIYLRTPGAEGCPTEQAIRAAVAARLGYDPFFPWANDSLFVQVSRAGGAFHVDLKLVDADNLQRGSRSISVKGNDCANAIDAMALTISLTIDPDALTRAPAPAPTPEPPAEPQPAPAAPPPPGSPPPSTEATPTVTEAPSSPVQFAAGGGAHLTDGAQPGLSAGLSLFAAARWRALSLDVEGRVDLPSTGDATAGVSPRGWIAAGAVVPCAHFGIVYGCGVGAIGSLVGTSVGASSPRTSVALWAAAGPRVGVEIPLSARLGVRAWTELLVALVRDDFQLDKQSGSPLYTPSPVSGGAGVALVWRFP